jgi:hypothetical protein
MFNKSFILACENIYMADVGLAFYLVGFSSEKNIFCRKNTPEIMWLPSLVRSKIVFFIEQIIPL